MNRIVLLLALTIAASPAVLSMDISPEQSEQIKLKSSKWGDAHQKAETLVKQGKFQEAETIYKQIMAERKELGRDLLTEYDRLGTMYNNWGKNKEAEEVYKAMIADREKSAGPGDTTLLYPLRQYAAFLDKQGRKAEAKALTTRAAGIEKESVTMPTFGKVTGAVGSPARLAEAEKARLTGELLVKTDQQKKALAYFNRALELNPKNAEALCDRGEVHAWFEHFAQATADYSRAAQLKSGFARAYVGRAFVHENQKQYPAAIADFDLAIKANPKDADAMGSRAKLLDEMGKHKEAIAGYTQAIAASPDLYWPYIQRAVAYTSLRQYKEAIEDYTVLVNRAPEDPDYHEYRGQTYLKAGDLQGALADFNKLIELSPKYATGYRGRAQVYEKLDGKKSQRALDDYAKAKKFGY